MCDCVTLSHMTNHNYYGAGVGASLMVERSILISQSQHGVIMENTGSDVSSADLDLTSLPIEGGEGNSLSLSLERNVVRSRRSLLSVINRRIVRSLHEVEFEICMPQPMSR